VHLGKWLMMKEKLFTDRQGKELKWEYVERTTKADREVDGIEIFATIMQDDIDHAIVIAVYRIPVENYVLEFPAGLVDPQDNDVALTALRELKEETGYVASVEDVIEVSPRVFVDPWKSTESSRYVRIKVDGARAENINPTQELEADEDIKVLLLPLHSLMSSLIEVAERENYFLDSRLYNLALGIELFNKR
jgi:8-oxo-dGTP pyrophosphatase MutT (NUDIX family)